MSTARTATGIALVAVLVVAGVDLALLRAGRAPHPLGVLGGVAATAVVLAVVRAALTVAAAARRRIGPLRAAADLLVMAGVALAIGGGVWNWARGFQGFVVLTEGDAVPLGRHLRDFRAGPLADTRLLDGALKLVDVKFTKVEGALFSPESHLVLEREGEPEKRIVVSQGSAGAVGAVRFHQGAFGFSPRIVVEESGRTLLDEAVPFETRGDAEGAVVFEGQVAVPGRSISVEGRVSLAELDPEDLKGHPILHVNVVEDGKRKGPGELLLGHFVEVRPGLRVGLAGMSRWSEIDVAHRSYRSAMLAGAGLLAAGLAAWLAAFVTSLLRRR